MSRSRTVHNAGVSPASNKYMWETSDGRMIPITKLDDVHLDNIIRMLEGKGMAAISRALELKDSREIIMAALDKWLPPNDEESAAQMEASLSPYQGVKDHPHILRFPVLLQEKAKRIADGRWDPSRSKAKKLRQP